MITREIVKKNADSNGIKHEKFTCFCKNTPPGSASITSS